MTRPERPSSGCGRLLLNEGGGSKGDAETNAPDEHGRIALKIYLGAELIVLVANVAFEVPQVDEIVTDAAIGRCRC